MIQLIIGIIIAILIAFYLFLRKSLQKGNLPAVSAPALSPSVLSSGSKDLSKGPNPPAVSEDINLPARPTGGQAGQAGLPAKSEDINLPAEHRQ